MKTKILFIALVCLTVCVGLKAQEIDKDFTPYGYSKINEDTVLEPALYAVSYRRSQIVINDATQGQEVLTDTLTLAIGNKWSLFFNASFDTRFSGWALHNRKIARQMTKPVNLSIPPVPLSTVLDKKASGKDYMEASFGEPLMVYTDRVGGVTLSCIASPGREAFCQQKIKEFRNWTLAEGQDTVLSHVCSKAMVHYAGRDYVAWYVPDIPISAGPWKLYGLPGLILKAEDSEGCFRFEAIAIETLERACITMDDNIPEVKVDIFNKMADKVRSEIEGNFLFEGELIRTVSHPYTYFEMER